MDQKKLKLRVFDAIAAPQRLQILRAIYNQGALSYVEIMNQINLNPSRDAGKFAYHLRMLRQAGLLETDELTKQYRLTSLGILVVDFTQNIEEHALREKGRLLVRTSRLAMEEFDRNKIVNALKKEAGVPIELARKIAGETEERLLRLDTLYLTAPLIREFVNAVLIEKGLQEYRHKLTRLGLPIYDVAQLIKKTETSSGEAARLDQVMGKNVMVEYVLLDALPRSVADAHLLGQIHLSNIDTWVLKPDSFQHDLRIFLRDGYRPSKATSMAVTLKPPNSLEGALAMISTILCSAGIEVTVEEGTNHFNLFLAPFVKEVTPDDLKDSLRRFLLRLNHNISNGASSDISLGFDLSVPQSLKDSEVEVTGRRTKGVYCDYLDESLKILNSILDIMIEDSIYKPLYYPQLILNLTTSSLKNKEVEPLLLKAHMLAAKYGNLYFTNLTPEWQKDATYFATGVRLASDWIGDSELDIVRTGSLGTVVVNLPRIAYDAKAEEGKFFNNLNDCLDIAIDSLKINHSSVGGQINRGLLPFLSQMVNGESYLRMKNVSLLVGFVGLNEAARVITGKQIYEDSYAANFGVKILSCLALRTKELSRKSGLRIAISQSVDNESPQRLAELDIEKFGRATVFVHGEGSSPYYTDTVSVPLEADISLRERLKLESYFHPLLCGGHLSLIELEEADTDALLKLTIEICQTYNIGAYAFTKSLSYCFNCKKVFSGLMQKCPECKATKMFASYSRLSSKYLPLELWPTARRENVSKRIRYNIV